MKKVTIENILYSPLYLCFKLHAMLPLRVLYILSDILFFDFSFKSSVCGAFSSFL